MEGENIMLETIAETQGSSMDAEKIISTAVDENGKRFYHVRWITYSWEPETSFESAEHMVKEFWEEYERLQKKNQKEQTEVPETMEVSRQKQKPTNEEQLKKKPSEQLQQLEDSSQELPQIQQQLQQHQHGQQQKQHQQKQQKQQQPQQHQIQQKRKENDPLMPLKLPIRNIKFKSAKTEEFVQAIEQTIEYVVFSFKENQKRLEKQPPSGIRNTDEVRDNVDPYEDLDTDEAIEYMSEEEHDVPTGTGDVVDADIADSSLRNLIKGKGDVIIVKDRDEAISIQKELMKPNKYMYNQDFGYPADGLPDLQKKRVCWQNKWIEYCGIPFICLGRRINYCAYAGGKTTKGGKCIRNFPCGARSSLFEYLFFPTLKIEECTEFRKKQNGHKVHDRLNAGDFAHTVRRTVIVMAQPSDHDHSSIPVRSRRKHHSAGIMVRQKLDNGDLAGTEKRVAILMPQPSDHDHSLEEPIRARCSNIKWREGVPGCTYDYKCKACYERRQVPGFKPKSKKRKKREEP